jgi:type IV pilus assembly protein PilV
MVCHRQKNRQGGFTLIEILIAVLIFSIGLLGLAAMQLTVLRSNTSAYNRSLATTLAYDIADRMRANKVAADANAYLTDIGDGPGGAGSCVGAGSNCDAAGLAAFDLDEWKCQLGAYNDDGACTNLGLKGDLPKGDGRITRNGNIFTVTVMWDDERTDPPGTGCSGDPQADLTCFSMAFEPPPLL